MKLQAEQPQTIQFGLKVIAGPERAALLGVPVGTVVSSYEGEATVTKPKED